MPVGQLLADEFFADPLFRLTKTTRPYFLQSCTLVIACRRLPEPPSGATAQIKDLRKLFKEIERVLYLGTIAPRDHQTETNEAFRAADEHLRNYIAKYNVTLALAPDTDEVKGQVIQPWKEASKKDHIAGSWIKKLKVLAGVKLESMKHIATLTLNISLWPEKPRKRENGEWLYTSKNLDVEIEKFASLNVLLHRLFWAKAMENKLGSFSLKQNPQFYTKFPNKKEHFPMPFQVSKSRSDVFPYIPALYVWDPVERYKGGTLHLIVDRDRSSGEIELEDLTKLHLPGIYGNGWYLDDDKDLLAVREKGRSYNLLLWNVKQPPVPSVNDSSTATLVEIPGLAPGLGIEELDKESELFAASIEPIPMTVLSPQPLIPGQMPQVGLPIHSNPSTAHPNSRHHTALDQGSIAGLGQHLTPALPSRRSLLEERTPPLQSLPKVQPPNTSSSKMSQVLTEGFSSASNPRNIPSSTPTISWTGQIPSSSSTHQETQSSTQAQKLLYDSASTFATSSTPADISKSNPARASDRLNPTSIPPSSLSLSPAQKSSSQTPADISSVSIPLKQANGSVPAKPASVKSSATIIENDPGQGLDQQTIQRSTGSLPTPNSQPPSSQVPPVSAPPTQSPETNRTVVTELVSAPKRRGAVVIKPPATPTPPASFDPHFASAAGSMQTVGAEAQVKKRGVRMWVKGKLENFVGRS